MINREIKIKKSFTNTSGFSLKIYIKSSQGLNGVLRDIFGSNQKGLLLFGQERI